MASTDDADANAVVGPNDAVVGSGGQGGGRKERATVGHGRPPANEGMLCRRSVSFHFISRGADSFHLKRMKRMK